MRRALKCKRRLSPDVLLLVVSSSTADKRSCHLQAAVVHSPNSQRSSNRVCAHFSKCRPSDLIMHCFRLYQVHVDIWYSWILSSHASSTKQEDFNQWTLQQPRKLTTWKGSSSAYTATPIGLPAGCKVGQSWRIGLWAMGSEKKQSDNPTTIELRAGSPHCGFGASVLPVVSSPVRITASEKKETSKQERILRRYAIYNTIAREGLEGDETGVDARRLVHIVEQTSFDLDKVRPTSLLQVHVSYSR